MLDKISVTRLKDVHPDLRKLIEKADELCEKDNINFRVTSGVRTAEEQMVAFNNKASKLNGIPKSKGGTGVSEHQYGMAVDLVVMVEGKPVWSASALTSLAKRVKEAAKLLKISIVWGGDWPKFVDMPHYQLDRKVYRKPHIPV